MESIALRLQEKDGQQLACVPVIGRVSLLSALPKVLVEDSVIGTVNTLRTTRALLMPKGGPWILRKRLLKERDQGLDVGTPLLEIALWEVVSGTPEAVDAESDKQTWDSPMAGQFYLRPAPDQPAFIQIGDIVETGTQIGLVEVMKFFYPLNFELEGRWKITDIIAQDSTSLDAGDPVIAIEPADG